MKQLLFRKPKLNANNELILDEKGEPVLEEGVQLFIIIGEQKTPIQVKDYMDTETYFKVTMQTDKNQAIQMKKQGYFMMNELIINPKIDDKIINKIPWIDTLKIIKALREMFMPEDSFLELGVQLDELSQK